MFERLVLVCLILLPWQTRYIFADGVTSVYVVEVLILFTFFVGGRLHVRTAHRQSVRSLGVGLVVALLSVLFALVPSLSFFLWLHLVFGALLFLLVLDERVRPVRALYAFVLGLLVPVGLGLYQVLTGTAPSSSLLGLASHDAATLGDSVIEGVASRWLRAYGTFDHPNVFGGYVATGLFCVLALLARKNKTGLFTKGLLFTTLTFFSFGLVASFSRSAWLGFLCALLVTGTLLLWKDRLQARRVLPFLSLTLLLLALSVAVFTDPVLARFSPELRLEERSMTERISEYSSFKDVFELNPLTGVGVGGYKLALEQFDPGNPAWSYQPLHNSLLLALSEVGVLGAIPFLFFVVTIDRANYASIRRGSVAAITAIGLGTILLLVALFDHYVWSSWSGLTLFAFSMAVTLRLSGSHPLDTSQGS